jgi:hypothetical protein
MSTGAGGDLPQLARTGAERAAASVLPAAMVTWTATEVMHMTGAVPVSDIVIGTVVLTAVSWGAAARDKRIPSSLPWWLAVAGGWVTAGDVLGPLAWWPAPLLTAAWIVYAFLAARFAYSREAVTSAREWRDARAGWLARRHEWHLGGSHLLDFERTRLGELYTVGTRGTGRRASQLATPALAEVIAEAEGLAVSRVRVWCHGLAGRLMISVRRADPWAGVLLHPLACEDHEITLPERRSILDPAVVGQDPETGKPLLVPLCTENGANRVSITASSGGGKGVFEDDLFEHVTACDDAVAVHLNLSVKGHEDEESWGPACWLTAYGPAQKSRAAAVLKVIAAVIEWRTRNFKRGQYAPSPGHPAIIIFNDESDSALTALREDINTVVTKGRSHGVGYVHLGQRNTRDYVDPKSRSQDNVRCTGLVQNSNEAGKAGSGAGPDMSTYGEGKPGVWKVELLGGSMHLGRTWVFSASPAGHGAMVERVAQERAYDQPELSAGCREYLGSAYEALRATEVFERWARSQEPGATPAGDDDAPAPDALPPAAALSPQDPATAPAAPAAPGRTALAERDPLEEMFQMDVDPGTRERIDLIHEKLGGARRILEEAAERPPVTAADPEALAARTAERWRQADEGTEVPAEVRPRLLAMLEGGGTTGREAAAELGVKRWKALTWLRALRSEGLARTDGEKRGTRWVAAPPPGDGDAP